MIILQMATIISLGVIACFASGFLCLLVIGIKWASSIKRDLEGEDKNSIVSRVICARCGTSFFDNPQLGLKDVLCGECKWPVCSACALRYPFLWLCTACIKIRDEAAEKRDCYLKDLKQRFPMTHPLTRRYGKRENDVRNLIEMLAENILGVCFENVKVNNMSEHVPYLDFMEKYEGVLSLTISRLKTSIQLYIDGVASNTEDSPTNIEMQLRELIQDIMEEASNIDPIQVSKLENVTKSNIASKTYEDILAVAILNKVMENFTLATIKNEGESDGKHPISGKTSDRFQDQNFEKYFLPDIQLKTKIRELRKGIPNESMPNKQKVLLPDLGFELPQEGNGPRWEENWLFRRKSTDVMLSSPSKKFRKRTRVPMFVPSPSTFVSPQIGDDYVDDVPDFSDLSDSEVELLVQNGY